MRCRWSRSASAPRLGRQTDGPPARLDALPASLEPSIRRRLQDCGLRPKAISPQQLLHALNAFVPIDPPPSGQPSYQPSGSARPPHAATKPCAKLCAKLVSRAYQPRSAIAPRTAIAPHASSDHASFVDHQRPASRVAPVGAGLAQHDWSVARPPLRPTSRGEGAGVGALGPSIMGPALDLQPIPARPLRTMEHAQWRAPQGHPQRRAQSAVTKPLPARMPAGPPPGLHSAAQLLRSSAPSQSRCLV